ncbi:hypothetical protein LCGC14_0980420 [marine sediment metagenome]|uniref:Peptidase S8/S53 domain-containing protein n=1 Tax=marine sediment metagenome TaxID=412755 RepID=A0A0F9N8X6_9ZZZZ
MKFKKIYAPFLKLIEGQEKKILNENTEYRVIISFENISKRDKFISKNKKVSVLKKFDFIPSICTNLLKENILLYEQEDLVKVIEEDQRLYSSILEVNEVLGIDRIKGAQISYTGKNVKVGIIDDGINITFPSVSNISQHYQKDKIKPNLKEITHGTIMASVIANQFKNENNHRIGIAPDVKILDFYISNSQKEYYFSNVLEIFDSILNQKIELNVILIPFITFHPSDGLDILSLACDLLVEEGVLIVCPSGNYGPNSSTIGSPGAAKKVITFGSLNKDFTITSTSGRGPTLDNRIKPDFCLPGSRLEIPLSNDLQITVTGSSVAAAIGAALLAIVKEFKPDLTYNEIYELIKNSCRDLDLDNNSQGFGVPHILNIFKEKGIYEERVLPYSYLVRKALIFSVEFSLILSVLLLFFTYFRIT